MNYRLAPAARADLRSIWHYTAENWSEAQADRYIESIEQACADVARGKLRGRDAGEYRPGYRNIRSGSHVIFYLTSDTRQDHGHSHPPSAHGSGRPPR